MSETRIPACRRVAKDVPRAVKNRHQSSCMESVASEPDTTSDEYPWPDDLDVGHVGCAGCVPCLGHPHCTSCRHRHADHTCPECVTEAREDLAAVAELCGFPLLEEVLLAGVESEAAMLLGPAANTEAWEHRAFSAMFGRVDSSYLEDCRDENHPLWVLTWIENQWREFLDQPTDLRATIPRSVAYLGRHLHEIAAWDLTDDPPEFADAKQRLHDLRMHLEDVLSDGDRPEKGAPCVQCGKTMERVVTDQGAQDSYRCPGCRRTVSGDQYRYAVGVAYRAHATALTVTDLGSQYGVKRGSVTGWAAAGKVRKRGKDHNGRQLYDVGDVLALHNGPQEAGA